ncbi:glycosyltransferase family 4 protein [Rhizobium sp. KVB221]|uniref:Glycosyltransferase family 4 protein n=1 Tax=Rhizobium setariae TaxID=2801340 RepID=A0A937CP28_9HYPH|nr:glycosyltransferase family 4 protein [Rhizobium setariae]MBL0371933.1 glycosyltransferase family 4 protein [Rhizobium setariae]
MGLRPRMAISDIEVIAPHFKRRLSGVTSTVVQLIPKQLEAGVKISTLGPGLPDDLPKLRYRDLLQCWVRPSSGKKRIWHARRNIEMVAGIFLRDVLRMPMKLVFTSAAQRNHTDFTKAMIRRMDGVIATSGRSGAFLEVPHTVVMHGIDTTLFHPPRTNDDLFSASGLPGKYAIGCSGRIRHQKGTDLFVDAMIALLPHYHDWTAIITGRVTAEHEGFHAELEERIAKAGLTDRIVFLGEVDDVKLWYRRFSLFVAPSRNEGFGLTPLEAMASATATVTSDAGAYAEMNVSGSTGMIVPAGDGDALRNAIEPYLADPGRAKRHGENALAHVTTHFEIGGEVKGVSAVYEATLAGER